MKLFSLVLALCLCAGLLAAGIAQEAPKGQIKGRVVMKESGKPLPKALVTIVRRGLTNEEIEDEPDQIRVKTDQDGNFSFTRIPVGDYDIEASARAHHANSSLINLPEGQRQTIDIAMEPDEPRLTTYFSQPVYLTEETPSFELTGFVPQDTVKLDVFKVGMDDLVKGDQGGDFYNGIRAGMPPPSTGQPVQSIDYRPVNRDVEGQFIDQVKLSKLEKGLYYVRAQADKLVANGYVNITDIGLVVRNDRKQTLCYVANLKTGKPVANAEIHSISKGSQAGVGTTDAEGQLSVPRTSATDDDSGAAFYASINGSFAICGQGQGSTDSKGTIALVTDRPVYRPGDTVQFKGLVRVLSGDQYTLPAAGQTASVDIHDDNGNKVTSLNPQVDAHGNFVGSWTSSIETKPGSYDFRIKVGDVQQSKYVTIASYRKPQFTVSVTPAKAVTKMGETAQAKVKCEYYYGAPVVGAKVNATIYRHPMWSMDPEFADEFGDDSDEEDSSGSSGGEPVKTIEATTNESGEAILNIPLAIKSEEFDQGDQKDRPVTYFDYTYSVNANVSDASGKGFDGSADFTVLQGDVSLHLKTKQDYAKVGSSVEVDVSSMLSGADKKPAPNQPVTLTLVRQHYLGDGRYKEVTLSTQTVTTDANGKTTAQVTLTKHGDIRIVATTKDRSGNTVGADTSIYSLGADDEVSTEPEQEQPKLTISFDKATYKVGDSAKVLLRTSIKEGTALFCVDGAEILSHQTVAIKDNAATIVIPVTESMAPNAYVTVAAVTDKRLFHANKRITLDWSKRDLKVELTAAAAKYAPGGTAQLNLRTLNNEGQPVSAQVSIGVVDESIYAIREDRLDLRKEFYPKRYNPVQTRFSFEEVYLDGGDKSPAHIPVRKKFRDTADWQPMVQTDADGKATVTVNLPENLTTWRATAVGITDQTDVGKTTTKFRTWKPLMVRLDAPTYMTNGDTQKVVVGVTNDTDKDADIKIGLSGQNIDLDGGGAVTKHVAAGKQADVSWQVKATKTGEAKLTAYAETTSANDAMEHPFSVVPRGGATYESHSGRLTADTQDLSFTVKPGTDTGYGELSVQVSPSVASSMVQSLDQLIDYPYGCVEQTLHRFVPSLVAAKLVTDLNLEKPAKLDQVPAIARQSLDRLATMQHADGSWGWWAFDSSSPLMTGLVLDGLRQAKELGYESEQINLKAALEWSGKYVGTYQAARDFIGPSMPGFEAAVRYHDHDYLTLALALAHYGQAEDARKVLDNFSRKYAGPEEWALAAQAFKALGDTSALNEAVAALHQKQKKEGEGVYWSGLNWYGSDGTTGLVFTALAEINPSDPVLPDALLYLFNHRRVGAWSSTMATAQILTGLNGYVRAHPESMSPGSLTVSLNGQPLGTLDIAAGAKNWESKVPVSKLSAGANKVTLTRTGGGLAYYSASLRQFGSQPSAVAVAGDLGIKVTRNYRLLTPGRTADGRTDLIPSKQPVSSAQSGDVVVCELTIDSPTDHEYVFVEDPLPSNCHVTQETSLEPGEQWSYWYSGMQIMDDRVGVFIDQLNKGRSSLTYYMRAETPGVAHALPTEVSLMYGPGQVSSSTESPIEVRP